MFEPIGSHTHTTWCSPWRRLCNRALSR